MRGDSAKITALLRGGMFPIAYTYPAGMRETRDLLRRRMHLVHIRGETLAHIQNTNSQYHLPPFRKQIRHARNRTDIAERFSDASVPRNVQLRRIDHGTGVVPSIDVWCSQAPAGRIRGRR